MPQPSLQDQINALIGVQLSHSRALETLQEEIQALKARVGALESEGPMRPGISPQFGPGHGEDS